MSLLLLLRLLLLLLCSLPQQTRAARVASREAPRVQISNQGWVAGREIFVTRTQRARQYLGIPFAQPPVGPLRFSPPVTSPLPSWDDVRNSSYQPACMQARDRFEEHDIQRLETKLFRFSPPVTSPLPSWDDVRNSSYQPACMQARDRFEEHDILRLETKLFSDERIEFSEDCLYLNVFAPDGVQPNEGWPVLVWFHSGNFMVGAAHLWDASVFAVKQKVIVVTTAYRLNIFGFMSTLGGMAPGNFGLLDQVAALDWVQRQIRDFGGDASKVVIGGHGAGAISVGLHLVSPRSSGKFVAALQMSGSGLMNSAVRQYPKTLVDELGDNFGCDEVLVCLRKISPLILLIQTGNAADWGPIVDGPYVNNSADAFLPAHPSQLFEEERFAKVPLMAGYTDMEEALEFSKRDTSENEFDKEAFNTLISDTALEGVPEPEDNETCYVDKTFIRDSVSFFYNSEPSHVDGVQLKQRYMSYMTEKKYGASIFNQSYHMSNFKPVFIYRFDYRMKTMGVLELQDWMTAPQFGEIPFVLGMPYWTSISSQIIWNSADKKVADNIMGLWGNFTKFFNPSQHGRNVKWDAFNPDMPSVMILDKVFNMSDSVAVNYKALSFWNDYFPKVVRIATQCCNATNHGTRSHRQFPVSFWAIYALVATFL